MRLENRVFSPGYVIAGLKAIETRYSFNTRALLPVVTPRTKSAYI